MDYIKETIEQLNKLPKGYISKKQIHGNEYYYLQALENGELKSSYVAEDELSSLLAALKLRKTLEKGLKAYLDSGKDIKEPSKRSRELTGSIMMGDKEVARFEKGTPEYIDNQFAPLMILCGGSLLSFLESRAIDRGRTNSRILKKALHIHDDEDYMVSLYSYGATITDNYWFRAKGSKLKYKDIAFDYDFYSDIALKGEVLIFPKYPKLSPQLTIPGSYEKCWVRDADGWYLYKQGTDSEIFSEMLSARIAEKLYVPTAKYEYEDGYIKTKNFTKLFNFEPMLAIAGSNDDYSHVFDCLDKIDERFAKAYIRLIWFDSIVNNVDRHNENCGLLRDRETGTIISLAPNFDNNLALISRSEVLNMDPSKDGFIKLFKDFTKDNKKAAKYYHDMGKGRLSERIIKSCIKDIPIKRDDDMITKYILDRYNYMISL